MTLAEALTALSRGWAVYSAGVEISDVPLINRGAELIQDAITSARLILESEI
jgi:hypothetical protein